MSLPLSTIFEFAHYIDSGNQVEFDYQGKHFILRGVPKEFDVLVNNCLKARIRNWTDVEYILEKQ